MVSDVRQRILDAAVKLLVEQGGLALTQPKIAAAAGVRQSHLTYYFPKRDDLMLAVTLHWANTHLRRATEEPGVSPRTLREAARIMADLVSEAARVRIILSLIVAAEEDGRIRGPLRELVQSERQSIGSLMRSLGLELDADGAALTHATLVGLAVLRVLQGDVADRETRAFVRSLLEELVPILAKPAARAGSNRRARKASA